MCRINVVVLQIVARFHRCDQPVVNVHFKHRSNDDDDFLGFGNSEVRGAIYSWKMGSGSLKNSSGFQPNYFAWFFINLLAFHCRSDPQRIFKQRQSNDAEMAEELIDTSDVPSAQLRVYKALLLCICTCFFQQNNLTFHRFCNFVGFSSSIGGTVMFLSVVKSLKPFK